MFPTATSIAPPSGIVKPRLQTSVIAFVSISSAFTSTHVSSVNKPGTDAEDEPLLPPRLSNWTKRVGLLTAHIETSFADVLRKASYYWVEKLIEWEKKEEMDSKVS